MSIKKNRDMSINKFNRISKKTEKCNKNAYKNSKTLQNIFDDDNDQQELTKCLKLLLL